MTKTQFAALWAAWKKNGAWFGRKGGAMGGSYRRMCERMAKDGLISAMAPYPITVKGMRHLREACAARWIDEGRMAYWDDLKEIEVAMAAAGMPIMEAAK